MPRFQTHDLDSAPADAKPMLEQVQQKLGVIPNILATLAESPSALKYYIQATQALAGGELDDRTREAIALAVAGANECGYCASAHGAKAQNLGADEEELQRNLQGESQDETIAIYTRLARAIAAEQGWAGEAADRAREAGASDAAIMETVALVAVNTFTNYFNHLNETEIDFPELPIPAGAKS